PMVLDELELNANPGSPRRREEGLWPAGRPYVGQAARLLSGLPHAAAGAGVPPAAMRGSHIWRRETTAYSQRSRVAAHAARACPSLSRLPSRPVRCACLARSTRLWRMPPHTARHAAARSAGRPRWEIRVLPARVAEV